MSTLAVTDIRRTGETASRSLRGVAAAWVNFNGTGTVAIRDSENVSSVTDNGTGDYTENFTSSMANASYSYAFAAQRGVTTSGFLSVLKLGTSLATGGLTLVTLTLGGGAEDSPVVGATIHGSLA